MSFFDYNDGDALGTVLSVDTATVVVEVRDVERLRRLQVNQLVVLQSSRPGQHLIGMVQRITRTILDDQDEEDGIPLESAQHQDIRNLVRITLVGTFIDKVGANAGVFRRTLETVPEIDANCFSLEGNQLTRFMRTITHAESELGPRLLLGTYTLDEKAEAYLDGNRFFQRHAVVVGSTGSGKSWMMASILEQAAELPNANVVVLDVHGEYGPVDGAGIRHYRVAKPEDVDDGNDLEQGVLWLPYWLLTYEEMLTMLVDRGDQNAPNQVMVFSRAVTEAKKKYLGTLGRHDVLANFTIDSPIPYSIDDVLKELNRLNSEMVKGVKGSRQGDFHGKLSRFIARLENKITDRRLAFMFEGPANTSKYHWLEQVASALMSGSAAQRDGSGGVKIIDLSEVPSDVLPLIVGLMARLVFSVYQWTPPEKRHPIALFCEEAHLYMPEASEAGGAAAVALRTFERVAKEGRKYGVGLVVVSQRPSEVSRTVLSQCNNVVAMRLTNAEDQNVVKRMLPDSLGGYGDLLPILDVGEALAVGDACLLPSRVRVKEPAHKPNSGTVNFWDKWASSEAVMAAPAAVEALRLQSTRVRPAEESAHEAAAASDEEHT